MSELTQHAKPSREKIRSISILRWAGAGEPLVFLHGIGSAATSWADLIGEVAAAAIAWDAPGYADSSPLPQGAPAPGDYARALAAMLDGLGLDRVSIIGHSLGSLFAGSFAALYPERVSKLVLLSPALGYQTSPGSSPPASVQARIDAMRRLGPQAFAANAAPRLVAQPEVKPQLVARIEETMAAVHPAGYLQAVHALGAGDLAADAAKIMAPTLVAVGDQDRITPPQNARRLHGALRCPGPFATVAGCGHALPQEAPGEVASLIQRFMRTNANV